MVAQSRISWFTPARLDAAVERGVQAGNLPEAHEEVRRGCGMDVGGGAVLRLSRPTAVLGSRNGLLAQ